MTKKSTEEIPVDARHKRHDLYCNDLPQEASAVVKPKVNDNEERLRRQIEKAGPHLRIEQVLHAPGCKAPCSCDVRAVVTLIRRYQRPERHVVRLR